MLEEAQVLSSAFPLLVFAVTRRLRLHGARQPGGAKDETSGDHKVESGRKARIGRAAQNQASSACVRACGRRPSTRTAGHVAVRMCVNKMSVLYWNSEDQAASERGGGGGDRQAQRRATPVMSVDTLATPRYGCTSRERNASSRLPASVPAWRIVGGYVVARPRSLAFVVSLQNSNGRHFCAGVVVSDGVVLTAAHCLTSGSLHRVVVGAHRLSTVSQDGCVQACSVRETRVHDAFSSVTLRNDVAVVLMDCASSAYAPIDALDDGRLSVPGVNVTVTGWGSTGETEPMSDVIRWANVAVLPFRACDSMYNGVLESGMMCAGVVEGGTDACYGDSGGPLFLDGDSRTLVGLVSWGVGCARPRRPGVYTRVAEYAAWLCPHVPGDHARRATRTRNARIGDCEPLELHAVPTDRRLALASAPSPFSVVRVSLAFPLLFTCFALRAHSASSVPTRDPRGQDACKIATSAPPPPLDPKQAPSPASPTESTTPSAAPPATRPPTPPVSPTPPPTDGNVSRILVVAVVSALLATCLVVVPVVRAWRKRRSRRRAEARSPRTASFASLPVLSVHMRELSTERARSSSLCSDVDTEAASRRPSSP